MASPFSGSAGRKASVWQMGQLGASRDTALEALDHGQKGALGALGQARTTYQNAGKRSLSSLTAGYTGAQDHLTAAHDSYNPYVTAGGTAFGQYQDAIGMNGADGATRARASFQAGPGYQWQVDQATDAAARKASALGLTASGNTLDAITRLGSNLADQEWDQHLTRLDGVSRLGYDAVGQQAGLRRSLADLDYTFGSAKAGQIGQTADRVAGTFGQEAGVRTGTAGQKASLVSNTGSQIAQAGVQGMMAGQNAAANRFGAIMGGLQLGAGVLGSAAGGGMPGLSSLLKGFGGGGTAPASTGQFEYPMQWQG